MPPRPKTRWFQLRLRTLLVGLTLLAIVPGGYVVYQRGQARRQHAAVTKLEAVGAEVYSRPQWLHSLLVPGAPGYVVGIGLRRPEQTTDANIAPLADLSELVWINLNELPITDAGLAHISGLKKLKQIRLDDTAIGDAGLAHLAGLHELRMINLSSTRITDAGLVHLEQLPHLEELYLQKTQITPAGTSRLMQAHPNLQIMR